MTPQQRARTIPRTLATPRGAVKPAPSRRKHPVAAKATLEKVSAVTAIEPAEEHPRPSHHNGVAVEREERICIGPNGSGKIKISRLFLVDGTMAHACWDCTHTAPGRGDIVVHRNEAHGTRSGKKPPKVIYEKSPQAELFDVVLPPRSDGRPAPESAVDWTLGEFLAIAPNLKAFGDLFDRLERENEELRTQTRVSRADQHKIDVYESNQQEIGELRAWKKTTIRTLGKLGFALQEDTEEE